VGKEQLELEAATAFVNPSECCGVPQLCEGSVLTAPPHSIARRASRRSTRHCARDAASAGRPCPTGAITMRHFTNNQVMGELEGLMEL